MKLFLIYSLIYLSNSFTIQRTKKIEEEKPSKFRKLITGKSIPHLPQLNRIPSISKTKSLVVPPEAEFDPCLTSKSICLNDGKCVNRDGMFTCRCPPTHYGKRCEILADMKNCKDNKCQNNSVCVSILYPKDVVDTLVQNKKTDIESTNKNLDNYIIQLKYDCICPEGFSGTFCEISDEELFCRESHCMNHGTGTMTDGKCICDCHSNYIGQRCETENPCVSYICHNSGKCEIQTDKKRNSVVAVCKCPATRLINSTITGDRCETIKINNEVDRQAKALPCRQNASRKEWEEFMMPRLSSVDRTFFASNLQQCLTRTGQTCTNHPKLRNDWCIGEKALCEPRVVRFPSQNSYLIPYCMCNGADTGILCEFHRDDACEPTLDEMKKGITRQSRCTDLDHGVCIDILGELKCDCRKGYVGEMCETYDPCSNKPCGNAECIAIPSETVASKTGQIRELHRCLCDMETDRIHGGSNCVYAGTGNCSSPDLCHNGLCLPCEHSEEDEMLNVCTDQQLQRGFRCICKPGFQPPYCENIQDPCFEHLCANNGQCRKTSKYDYECTCNPGTRGTLCEHVFDYCRATGNIQCLHGTCQEDISSLRGFSCLCYYSYYGKNCEHKMLPAEAMFAAIMEYYWITLPLISIFITCTILVLAHFCSFSYHRNQEVELSLDNGFPDDDIQIAESVSTVVTPNCSDPEDDDIQILGPLKRPGAPIINASKRLKSSSLPMGSPSSPDYGNSESLNTLLAMGFSEEQIPLALRLADGDLEKAVLYLTGEVPGLDDYMSNSASGTVSRLSNGSVREEGCGRLRLPSTSLSTVQNYIYQGRSLFYKSGNALDRCVKAASKICEEDVNAIDSKLDDFLINSLPEVINRHSSPVDEIRLDAEAIDLCYAFFELVVPLLALSLQRPNCFVVACRGLCEIFNPDSKYNKATRRRDPTPELEKLLAAHDVHTDTNKFLAVNSAPLARLQQGIENFCQENGFVTIQKVVKGLPRDNGDSLEHMLACVQLSNFVIPYLIPSKFIGATADWMDRGLDIIESLHEKDIRSSYARTCVLDLLEELNKLSYHIPSTEHHGENGRLDICRLEFTLKCLKCSQLEARMFALNDLCLLAQSVRENNPIVGEELLNDWLKENKILHAVLSGNLDMAAYVEKTNKLLAYMAPIMSDSDIVYIWSLRKGRLGVSPERFQSIVSHIASQFSFEQMIFTCDLFQKAFKTGEHRTFEKVFNICADVTRTSENDEVVKMIIYQMWDYIVTAKSFHYDISHALDIHAEMISFKKKFDYRDEFVKRSLIVLLKHKDQEKIVLPILFVVYIRNILALGVRETQNISGIVTRKTSVLRAENNAWGDQASDVQRRTELKKLLVEQNLFHHVVRNIIKCQKFAHIRSMELQDCVIPGENSRSCFDIEESLDPFLMDVADGYTYGQVIQFSLKLLAWMFENDVVVYTNDKIQALWSALVESEQSTPPEKSEFFHWIMRLRRDIIKDEALLQFLGLFGKLDPLHITVDGMKAFFEIYHRLAITAIGVNDEDLRKHWNTVWEILENVEDPLVVDNITGRIVKEDRNSVAARPFVDFCLKRLKRQMEEFEKSKNGCPTEASPTFLRKVNRNLCVLAKFTSVNEANFLYSRTRTLHSTIVPGRPVRVDMYCETFDIDQKALSISTHTNELLAHFKSRIDRRLGFYGIDSYTMHVDWGDDEDREISMRHPWKTLEQIALVPSNEDVLYSNYGILRVRLFIRNINSLRPLQRVSFDTNKVLEDDLPSTFIHTDSSIYSILYSLPIGKDKKMTAVRRQLLDILPNDIKVEKAFEIYKKEVDSNLEYGKCVIKYSFCKIQEVKSVLSLDTPHKFLYGLEVLCGMLMPTRYSIVSAHQSCNTISALTNSDIVEHIMNNVETLCSNFKNYNIAEDSLYLDIIDRANLLLRYFLLNKFTLKESAIEDIEICDHLEHTSPEFGCNKGKMDQIRTVSNIFSSRLETLEKWSLNRIIHFANVWIKIIDVVRSNNNHLLGNLTERGVERFGEEGDRDVFSVEQALYATKDLSSDSLRVSFLRSKLTVECLRLLMEIIQQFVVVKDEAIYYELLSKFVFDNTWTGFAQSILLDGRDNLLRHVGCFYLVSILRKCSMGVSALSLASLCELIVPVLYDERPSSKLNKLDLIRRTNLLDITQTVSSVLVNTTMSGSADDIELWNNVVAGIVDLVVPLTEKIISIDVDRSFELADGALISSLMEIIRGLVASGNLDETITSEVGDFIITKLINGKLFPGYSVNDDNFTDLSSVSPPSRWNDFGIRKQAVALLLDLAATNHGSNAIRLLEKLHLCYENESINGWEFEPDVEEKLYNRVGLKNDGGTCYMNSILQQIYAIEPIARQFVGLDVNTDLVWENGLKSELIVELQRVFGHLYFLLEKICVPRGFWEVFRFSGDDHLDTKKQHDAIDFLTELVDKCDTIMEKMKLPLLFKPQLSGKFAYEYICYECYTRHQGPEEEYLTVNLELHGTTLEDSLQHYVDGEILEGENAYHCRECNSKRTTLRRGSFYTLPNTLSIQLKRFTFDYTGRQAQKNNEYCKFPEFLDMNPYMKHSQTYDSKDIDMLFEEIHSTQKLGSTTKSATGTTPHPSPSSPMKMRRRRRISTLPTQQVNPEDYHYELVGVLAHSGLAAAGHYFSFVKDQNCDSKKSKWFELNDSQVKPFDVESEAENTWFGGHFRASKNVHNLPEERTRTWNAYVLFYQKKPITGFGNTGDITPRIKNLNQNDIFNSMPPWLRLEIVNKNTRFIKERDLYSDEYRDLMLEAANQFYTSMCQLSANERITYKEDMCVKALKFILSFCSRILWRLSSMFRCAVVLEKSQNVLYQLLSCSGNVRRSFLHLLSENNYKIFEDLCDCPNLEVFKSFFDNISFILVSWVTREESIYNSDKEFVFLRKSLRLLKNEYYHNIDNAEIVVDMLAKMGRTEGGLKILWDYEVSSILCDLVVSLYENDHIPRLRISDRDLRHDRLKAIPALFLDILNFGLFQVDQIDESRLALTKISVHYLLTWIYCTTPESRSTREKVVEVLAEADEKLGPEFTASRMNALLHWITTTQVISMNAWESVISLIIRTVIVREKLGHTDCGRALCLFLDEQEVPSAEDSSLHSGVIPWLEHMISKGAIKPCNDMVQALELLYSTKNSTVIPSILATRVERLKIIGQRIEECTYDSQVSGVYDEAECSRKSRTPGFMHPHGPDILDITEVEPIALPSNKMCIDEVERINEATQKTFTATALVTSSSEDIDFKKIM